MTKSELRRRMTAALENLSEPEREAENRRLNQALGLLLAGGAYSAVLATLPTAGEPDLRPALARWLAAGGRVALARTGPGRSLSFHWITSFDGPWERHRFGIDEPPGALPRWSPETPALCLVPGLAFARRQGRWCRLGRGAGYYDRWLAGPGAGVTALGVGFGIQRVESLPTEDHDAPLAGFLGA